MEEEGLLLDALAITAQPLAIVANSISPEQCSTAGLQPSQLTVVCKRPPYQLQLRVQQVIATVSQHVDQVLVLSFFVQHHSEHLYQAKSRTETLHRDCAFDTCAKALLVHCNFLACVHAEQYQRNLFCCGTGV